MRSKRWRAPAAGLCAIAFLTASSPAAATGQDEGVTRDALSRAFTAGRIRTSSSALAALMDQGVNRSTAFRDLIAVIDDTDGVVYVEPGTCPHGVRACLLMEMAISGPNRLLYVLVDTKRPDTELIVAIAHELRHAVEVLSNRTLRSGTAIYFFYRLNGTSLGRGAFETPAAVETGEAVRAQLQNSVSP